MNKKDELVEVYKATNEMEAQVIKSLLESYEIPCFLRSSVGPSPFGFTPGEAKVMVRDSDLEEARKLINGDNHV